MTEILESKVSVQFVLNVLRQHEIEFDRLVAELGVSVERVNTLVEKMEQIKG
jgi:hypothetical protein